MSANPYEAATVSNDFRTTSESESPNRIEWGNIVLCYLMGCVIYLLLMFGYGLVLGFVTAAAGNFGGSINAVWLGLVMEMLVAVALVVSVLRLVRRVRSRKFVHTAIFAGANFGIDVIITTAYSSSLTWQQYASIPTQVVVVLVTGWLATRSLKKVEARSQVSAGGV